MAMFWLATPTVVQCCCVCDPINELDGGIGLRVT